MSTATRKSASLTQLGRDLFWSLMTPDGEVKWVGYDDKYWWDNAPDQDLWRVQEIAGTRYTLDARTCEVRSGAFFCSPVLIEGAKA
jgi:hypothetical protein